MEITNNWYFVKIKYHVYDSNKVKVPVPIVKLNFKFNIVKVLGD